MPVQNRPANIVQHKYDRTLEVLAARIGLHEWGVSLFEVGNGPSERNARRVMDATRSEQREINKPS
jgi:hypothetical protein